MMSATEALSSIERALQGVRKDEDRLVSMLSSAETEAGRLRTEQAEAFRALARLRLDAIAGAKTVEALDQAERRALEAVGRRRKSLEATAKRRGDLSSSAEAIEDRRRSAAEARDAVIKRIEALAERVEAVAAKDPAWQAADSEARDAEAKAVAAEEKAKLATADRETKGKPYEADTLFMYLWTRRYGTSEYRAGSITRMIDGWVARLIGFETARVNYYTLTEIPQRLAEHAARQREIVAEAIARREAVERRALEGAGVAALESELAESQASIEAAEADVTKVREALTTLDAETKDLLDETADPAIRTAVDDLAKALSRDDLRSLYRAALETATPEDETIVKKLQEIERDLVRVTAQMEEVRAAAVELARKRAELERSETNFRKSGYDDPFGEFLNGAVIGGIIDSIIRGAANGRTLDEALGREYRRRAPRGSSRGGFGGGMGGGFGGGIRLPGGFPGFPGGSGGRSSGSRPSSGGGGFRTGGSF
jgi:chromosome segregation ATPase